MIKREVAFFVANGLISVAIAYWIYRILVSGGLSIELSNGLAYLSGMVYGFLANKKLAFRDVSAISRGMLTRYVLWHAFSLMVNVVVNSVFLAVIGSLVFGLTISFLLAISITTVLNYLGLKYFVFKNTTTVTE
jgi:putative flippase GtrA